DELARSRGERGDLDVEVTRLLCGPPRDVAQRHRMPLHVRLLDPRAQLDRAERDLEVLDRPPEVALRQAELHARLQVREREISVTVDRDEGDRHDVEPG